MDNRMLTAAVIAGVAMGVLSGLPCIGAVNCIFCAWVWGSAIFGVWFYARSVPQVSTSQGAILGVIAAVIGAVINSGLSFVINLISGGSAAQFAQVRDILIQSGQRDLANQLAPLMTSGGGDVLSCITGLVFSLIIFAIFGAIGGVVGAALFGKPKTMAPPPAM